MKKLVLLLFLFLSFIAKSQPPGMYPPYMLCDDSSNDGFAVFDLTTTLPIILDGLDSSIHEVHFFPSDTDSANNTNEIVAPAAYTNIIQGTQTLGIRIINTSTSETHLAGMNIVVNSLPAATISGTTTVCQNSVNPVITITGANGTAPYIFTFSVNGILQTIMSSGSVATLPVPSSTVGSLVYSLISVQSFGTPGCSQSQSGTAVVTVDPSPVANPATLSFCDPTELPIYVLSDANGQITGGVPGMTVTYHLTQADAQIPANALPLEYIPTINPGTQTLFARVQDNSSICFSVTTLTLNTQNCTINCPPPGPLIVLQVTDTTLLLSWNPDNLGSSVGYASVVPLGQPPSNSNLFPLPASPNVPFAIEGLSPEGCYSVYAKRYCDLTNAVSSEWSEPLNICMTNCADTGGCSDVLILNAFIDSNSNGIKDSGEANFSHGSFSYQINDSGTNISGIGNDGSYYIFDTNPANSYDISFNVNANLVGYYASATTYSNVTLPDGSGAVNLYFPVTQLAPYSDAKVFLYNQTNPRPGFVYTLSINYSNNGVDTIANGTLTFTKDPNLTISSVSQAGIIETPTGFSYNFSNLGANEYRNIQVYLQVPTIPTVAIGQLVSNSVTIQTANDANNSNNTSNYTQAITGSYDPNDKSESHGGKIGLDNFTDNDYLYYTIRFENTGTASTEFIRVEDVLDDQLDENSFEMLSASHAVNTTRSGSKLTWHFYNTQIPPTSIDAINSHGYVYFKIKPKTGYAVGNIIPNKASIYFDYNPPITTNTHNTEFFQTLRNAGFNADVISMYPNPTSNLVTISNANTMQKISKISIYEITGKRIYTLTGNILNTISIDVSAFSRGIYLVELSSEEHSKVTKKLILK